MNTRAKALHPIRVDGRTMPAGAEIDPDKIGPTRLERLIAKGRVAAATEAAAAPVNRAETQTGRPGLRLPADGVPA